MFAAKMELIKNSTLCKHHKVSSLILEYPFWEQPSQMRLEGQKNNKFAAIYENGLWRINNRTQGPLQWSTSNLLSTLDCFR